MKKKKFKNFRKRKKKVMEIDITSLLDILVILLVFLLKSYNPTDLKLDVANNLTLPLSDAQELGNKAIVVQVNKDRKIFVDHKEIGQINSLSSSTITSLLDKLKEYKLEEEKSIKEMESRAPASNVNKDLISTKKSSLKKVNIVLDKSLPYAVLRQVMHTAAMAGYPEFKFIVQGQYQ